MMVSVCVSEAFYKQLKSLRITDFPCGLGSWRQSPDRSNADKDIKDQSCAQFESVEDLLELNHSGLYAVDCTWSKETTSLRKVAIDTPEALEDPDFVLKHFTTLRIVNENVSHIDAGILKFINLKELILSANFIDELDANNFPKGLEVLELAANNIKDFSGLKGNNLSSLLHLGLAHNKVSFISSRAMTPSRWPSLLSLDLSYNNLGDLKTTVEILKHLTTLRNLLLIGNPLYLSKCYHGLIIDSMPGLLFLDNAEISADDRHHFKSLSRLRELDINGSQITVEIAGISGVKNPVQGEEFDSVPEYPKIEFKYHVEFTFLKDLTSEDQVDEACGDDQGQEDSTLMAGSPLYEGDLQLVSTDKLLWADAIDFYFNKTYTVHEPTRFRDFLKNGMTFTVVGVKHSYVLEDPKLIDDDAVVSNDQPGEKRQTKSAAKDRSKDVKEKGKIKSDKGGKDKGKKDKRDTSELFELPQVRKIVGSCHVPLGSLLEGEAAVKVCCPCEEEMTKSESEELGSNNDLSGGAAKPQSGKRSDVSDKKKNKGDGDKHLKATPTKGKTKDRAKSAAVLAKGTKVGKGKEKVEEINEDGEDEIPAPPPPLSINLEIKLERLKNTKDALQESKNQVLQNESNG